MEKNLRSFACVCDKAYFPGLWSLINSIYEYNGVKIPLYLFDIGLTRSQRTALLRHPLTVYIINAGILPFRISNAWDCKQQVLYVLSEFSRYILLVDADVVFTGSSDDYFDKAEKGYIVSYHDKIEQFDLTRLACFRRKKNDPGFMTFNSGFLCIDVKFHWDIVTLWAHSLRLADTMDSEERTDYFAGYGDQGVINSLVFLLDKKDQLYLIDGCLFDSNSNNISIRKENQLKLLTMKTSSGEIMVNLIHCIGPKWWQDNATNFFLDEEIIQYCMSFKNNPVKMPLL